MTQTTYSANGANRQVLRSLPLEQAIARFFRAIGRRMGAANRSLQWASLMVRVRIYGQRHTLRIPLGLWDAEQRRLLIASMTQFRGNTRVTTTTARGRGRGGAQRRRGWETSFGPANFLQQLINYRQHYERFAITDNDFNWELGSFSIITFNTPQQMVNVGNIETYNILTRRMRGSKRGSDFIYNLAPSSTLLYTFSPQGEEGDCLLEAFRFVLRNRPKSATTTSRKTTPSSRQLRHTLSLPPEGNLPLLPVAERLGKHLNVTYTIIVGATGDDRLLLAEPSLLNPKTHTPDLILFVPPDSPEHVVVVRKIQKKDRRRNHQPIMGPAVVRRRGGRRTPIVEYFIGFDYETVHTESGDLLDTCCSYALFRDKPNWDGGDLVAKGVSTLYRNSTNVSESFVDWLEDILRASARLEEEGVERGRFHVTAYNGSRFDTLILLPYLIKRGGVVSDKLFIAQNSIMKMEWNGVIFIDLCRFVMLSLSAACKGFGCALQKAPFDHNDIQCAYNDNILPEVMGGEMGEKLEKYCMLDTLAMCELWYKVGKAMSVLVDKDMRKHITLAKVMYTAWRTPEMQRLTPAPPNQIVYDVMRQSAYGGRCQVFRKGIFDWGGCDDKRIVSMDVKSLYPFVMINCDFPTGPCFYSRQWHQDRECIGIYRTRILSQKPNMVVIPRRTDEESLDWDYTGPQNVILTTIDLQTLKEAGASFQVGDGYAWASKGRIFEVIAKLARKKTELDEQKARGDPDYNPALRALCKLLMNSLSGKLLQKPYPEKARLAYSYEDALAFTQEHRVDTITVTPLTHANSVILHGVPSHTPDYTPKTASLVGHGSLIYSYARRHMFLSTLMKIQELDRTGPPHPEGGSWFDDIFYTDTDSLHMRVRLVTLLNEETEQGFGHFHVGGEFGDFEPETKPGHKPACRGFYLGKKIWKEVEDYDAVTGKPIGEVEAKWKGVGDYDRVMPTNYGSRNDLARRVKEMRDWGGERLYRYYMSLPTVAESDVHEDCANGHTISLMCNQLVRETGQHGNFGVRQFMMIKQFNLQEEEFIKVDEWTMDPITVTETEEEEEEKWPMN